MRKNQRLSLWLSLLLAIFLLFGFAAPVMAIKYAGEFLYLGAGGRPLALGGAYVAESGDLLSGYYNPAGLARMMAPEAAFMHSETFGSLLNHDFISYARPMGGESDPSAFGVSLFRLGGGGIIITGVDQTGRFQKLSEESHADYAGYFSYGRGFGDRLSAGVTAKLIYRDIIDESAVGIGFDIGALYAISDWASVGMNLQDAPGTFLSYSTGWKERVNLTSKLGVKLHSRLGRFRATGLADSDIRFEGRDYSAQASMGPVSFDSHFGLEVVYLERLAARIGSDVGQLTLGAGISFNRYIIDIAMRDHSDLDNTYLVSLKVKL